MMIISALEQLLFIFKINYIKKKKNRKNSVGFAHAPFDFVSF